MKVLGAKPLVAWILDSIIASKTADEIWVATDDDTAESFLKQNYPNVKIFRRCVVSASDTSPVIDVVMEFLENVSLNDNDFLVLAQATSPFTPSADFRRLYSCISDRYDSYISCTRSKKFLWHEDGYPLSYHLDAKPRRQDYTGYLIENGEFYASTIGSIRKSKNILYGRILVLESRYPYCIEIDDSLDWQLAEIIANQITINK